MLEIVQPVHLLADGRVHVMFPVLDARVDVFVRAVHPAVVCRTVSFSLFEPPGQLARPALMRLLLLLRLGTPNFADVGQPVVCYLVLHPVAISVQGTQSFPQVGLGIIGPILLEFP